MIYTIKHKISRIIKRYRKNLLVSDRLLIANIAFTTRCNIQCVYCATGMPGYYNKARDLDLRYLDEIISTFKKRKVKEVFVNGHGETTMLKNWRQHCGRLQDEGFHLKIISNFAREYNAEEINTFTCFKHIGISCDTVDFDFFKKLRRGGDLNIILKNISRIKEASKNKQDPPRIIIYCIVMDKNVFELKDFVRFWISVGVDGFEFSGFVKLYNDIDLNTILTFPADKLKAARESIEGAMEIARSNGNQVTCWPALLETIDKKLKVVCTDNTNRIGSEHWVRKRGWTKDCLCPWGFVMIHSDASVLPCCWHRSVGKMGEEPLDRILNGKVIRKIRKRLLTGRPDDRCATCPATGSIPIKDFRKKVFREIS